MLAIGILAGDVYKLTVIAIIHSIFTFKIENIESKGKKYELVYHPDQKPLLRKDFVLYVYINSAKDGKAVDTKIPKRETKSPLTLALPQLCPDIYTVENLCIAFIEFLEFRFGTSSSLSNIDHIYHHAYAVILIGKDIGFFSSPHRLDTLFPPILTLKVVDKVDCYHSHLFLEQINAFHTVHIE